MAVGWGRSEWGSGPWGEPAVTLVNVTGLAATSALGTVTTDAEANVAVTGQSATGAVSGVGVNGNAVAVLPSIVSSVGTPSVLTNADANVTPTGQEATSAVGTVTVTGIANVDITGQEATASVGSVTVIAKADVDVTGQEAIGAVGTVAIIGLANVTPTGQEGTSAVGTVTIDAKANVNITGVDATSAVGSVTVDAEANVTPTGQEATGAVSGVGVNAQAVAVLPSIVSNVGTPTVLTNADANVFPTGLSASASLPSTTNEWTANNGAAISTAQSKFGGASLLLDGVNDNVISNTVYDFQSTAFTIEFWARPANVTQDEVLLDTRDSISNTSIYFRQAGTTLLIGRGTVTLLTVNNVFSANTWVSLAVTRGNPFTNTYTVFVDGNNEGDILLGAFPTASDIHIGSDFNNTNNWSGYIDEIRLSNVDRYGGTSYTPATSEFSLDANTLSLLHLDGTNGSTSIIDEVVNEPLVVTGTANIFPTGVAATGSVGSVTFIALANVYPIGVSGTGQVGSITPNAAANIYPNGVSATGQVGKLLIWSRIDESQTPNYTTITDTQSSSFSEIDDTQIPTWEEVA